MTAFMLGAGTIIANVSLFAIVSILYILAGSVMLRYVVKRHRRKGFVCSNYRGENIPTGLGVFLWMMLLAGFVFYLPIGWGALASKTAPEGAASELLIAYLCCLSGVFAAGWVDDRFGDRKIKGLLGHIRQLLMHGKVTTGLWKAFIGIMLAALFAYTVDRGWGERLFHMSLIAMSMNAVNLFDLRPGRALKLFAAGSGLLFVFALGGRKLELWLSLLYPLSVASVIILPSDLRARTMLGDCGANLLGFALGCGLVLLTGFPWQLTAAGALVFMHIAAERISFTAVIERNVWMNWLDRLGRTEK
ncbi:hypothetical protein [Paenibacillus contaminans]|uniref:UDP-N-acetylmuramyl pentapeptide phosphotransferase n=1 Tax=Paenibacillus contaminans TaxID=450362 RepID=A0A329MG28_9BACL|nr:hypothetical protein [Paenibacillus contaminans]RAV18632.1 hypothetical protein DQG23_25370 [Paenibacillus contaminans]